MTPEEREYLMFRYIKTEEDYWKLRSTGLAWELFPTFPQSWEEFCMREQAYNGQN